MATIVTVRYDITTVPDITLATESGGVFAWSEGRPLPGPDFSFLGVPAANVYADYVSGGGSYQERGVFWPVAQSDPNSFEVAFRFFALSAESLVYGHYVAAFFRND